MNNQQKGGEEKGEEAKRRGGKKDEARGEETRREAFDDQIVSYTVVFQPTLEFSMHKDGKKS